MNNFFQKISPLIFLIISLLNGASIQGVILDKETKAPLIGANVFIQETSNGSATDVEGMYLIEDVNACETCEYTLKVLYIGYEEYSTTIEVKDNIKIVIDLLLSSTSLEVETTKITAKKRQDKITDAPAAIELVSAKDIKR